MLSPVKSACHLVALRHAISIRSKCVLLLASKPLGGRSGFLLNSGLQDKESAEMSQSLLVLGTKPERCFDLSCEKRGKPEIFLFLFCHQITELNHSLFGSWFFVLGRVFGRCP